MKFTVITGPTFPRNDGGLYDNQFIPSFEERLNAALEDLRLQGARNVQVDCKPSSDCQWHSAYIRYDGELTVSTEFVSIDTFATQFKLSRSTVQDRIRRGKLIAKKVGPRWLIPSSEVDRVNALHVF